jgi:hypothetical protein
MRYGGNMRCRLWGFKNRIIEEMSFFLGGTVIGVIDQVVEDVEVV